MKKSTEHNLSNPSKEEQMSISSGYLFLHITLIEKLKMYCLLGDKKEGKRNQFFIYTLLETSVLSFYSLKLLLYFPDSVQQKKVALKWLYIRTYVYCSPCLN